MTADMREKIQRHIAAKVADEDFRDRLAETAEMRDVPIVKVMTRIICAQLDIDVNDEAERLASFAFAAGHAFGRDLGSVEGVGFPS